MTDQEKIIHTVKSETETLNWISEQYNISIDELYLINQLDENSVLHIGQEITLSTDSLTQSLLFGIEDYHSPDCSGCNQNLNNCGNSDCECDCENIAGSTHCAGEGSCL